MKYKQILRQIAHKHGITATQAHNEMALALKIAGVNMSVGKFIEVSAEKVKKRRYIV